LHAEEVARQEHIFCVSLLLCSYITVARSDRKYDGKKKLNSQITFFQFFDTRYHDVYVLAIAIIAISIRERSVPKSCEAPANKKGIKERKKAGKKARSHREQAGPVAVAARAREKEAETREEDRWQSDGSSIMEEKEEEEEKDDEERDEED